MSVTLPPEIQVRESRGRTRFLLPHRRAETKPEHRGGVLGCGLIVLVVALVLGGIWVGTIVSSASEKGIASAVAAAVFGSPLGFFGGCGLLAAFWLLFGGRTVIIVTRDRLLLREWVGPAVFPRSIPLKQVRAFRVHPFSPGGRGALDIELEAGGTRRWAIEHALPLLEALASELTRRKEAGPEGRVKPPADVEAVEGGVRVTLPPPGWMGEFGSTLVAVAAAGALAFGTGQWTKAALNGGGHLVFFAVLLGALWLALLAHGVAVGRRIRRTTVLEYGGKALRITESDPLGRRTREWPRSEVWGFEVFQPRDSSETTGTPELQVRLSNGKRPRLLRRRDLPELEWVASVLRRGRPASKPVKTAVVERASAGGICQICGAEMEERIVWCADCRTPHHRECWEYAGMCSTYGCRQIRFEGSRG